MGQYYCYNEKGEKVGPVSGRALQSLAAQGVITPDTQVELPDGRAIPARKIRGLTFSPANVPPQAALPAMVPSPFPFTPLNSTDNPFSLPIPSDNPFTLQAPHNSFDTNDEKTWMANLSMFLGIVSIVSTLCSITIFFILFLTSP